MKTSYDAYKKYPFSNIFGSVVKQQILKFFTDNPQKEFNVLEISKQMGLNQSSLSKPLTILRKCGLLVSKKEGKFTYYCMEQKYVNPFRIICNMLQGVKKSTINGRGTTLTNTTKKEDSKNSYKEVVEVHKALELPSQIIKKEYGV